MHWPRPLSTVDTSLLILTGKINRSHYLIYFLGESCVYTMGSHLTNVDCLCLSKKKKNLTVGMEILSVI